MARRSFLAGNFLGGEGFADTGTASQYAKLASTEFASHLRRPALQIRLVQRQKMEKIMRKVLLSFGVVTLVGCASPTIVQTVKPGDTGLSCAQLQNEFSDAERFKREAEGEKGATGGNAARLLFWPAIVGTYMNANEAIAAAETRKVHLANLMNQKACQVPGLFSR